jgi:hypothetical protein
MSRARRARETEGASIDAILEALCELDGGPRNPLGGKPKRRFSMSRARPEENSMEDVRLPRHVIDRLEHRWARRLQQDAKAWSIDRKRPVQARHVQTDGSQVTPVVVKRVRGGSGGSSTGALW